MIQTVKTIEQTFEDLALIHEDTLSSLKYLSVYALNYTYIDFESHKMVISGTESDWMTHMIRLGLHQEVAHRLREYCYDWSAESETTKAYTQFMTEHHPELKWRKTDFGLKGKHGFHLLEIGHTQELGIETFNAMADALNEFKFESIRLQEKYPAMLYDVESMPSILDLQAVFLEQDQALQESMKIEFDDSLFEPLEEPTLSKEEDTALSLRVQWYEDDEIADQMALSLKEVKQIFISIKDKYHQPKIPQRVYLAKRKELFPELFN